MSAPFPTGQHTATRAHGEHVVVVDQPTDDTVRVRFDEGHTAVVQAFEVFPDLHSAIRHHLVRAFDLMGHVPETGEERDDVRATLDAFGAQRMLRYAAESAQWRADRQVVSA